jgi:hypothetical protein
MPVRRKRKKKTKIEESSDGEYSTSHRNKNASDEDITIE